MSFFFSVSPHVETLKSTESYPLIQKCYGTVFATPGDKLDGDVAACGGKPLTHYKYGIAHRSLPCGTKVKLTHERTGKTVTATVVDRGPYGAGDRGYDWYIKRYKYEPPPLELCDELGDDACNPRPWRGCVDMLPAVGRALGVRGRAWVKLRVLHVPKKQRK